MNTTVNELLFWAFPVAIAAFAAAFTYHIRGSFERRLAFEQRKSGELASLRSALNQIDIAVALIGPDLKARFINRAYRKIFNVPDEMAESKPKLEELLEHKFDQRVYEIRTDKRSYVAARLARITSGDERPLDLRLTSGDVVRFRSKALADGGWMLNYGNVSDLIHTAEELALLAKTDALTGAYNRRHFLSELHREWNRFVRHGCPLSLLMIDFDGFKSINDRFGHDAGDQVLRHAAALWSNIKREADIFARLGGDEFALLLPQTTIEEGLQAAERLRVSIAAQSFIGLGVSRVTVTIGAAQATEAATDLELIKRADEALYIAKSLGRNQIAPKNKAIIAGNASAA